MSLQDAIDQLAGLAPRAAGHLVRHQDWNTLIAALGELGATVGQHDQDLTELQGKVQGLEQRLGEVEQLAGTLDERLGELEQRVTPLLGNYLVTLSCARLNFATGELAELTAKVTDLTGQPLAAPFPWVDFVAAWGRLRAVSTFTSRAGAGDNSLSVQVNAQGIARVQLRAEHTEGLAESDEDDVRAAMEMQVAGQGMSVAEVFRAAATPGDQRAKAAYKVMHAEYDRKDSPAMRNYADAYVMRNPQALWVPAGASAAGHWLDYRATVIALAKPDADPTTADGARGAASIQVTFRDWIAGWTWDYYGDLELLEDEVVKDFGPVFDTDDIYGEFQKKFDAGYAEHGLVGRQKYLSAVQKAMQRINPGPDVIKQDIKGQLESALTAQRASETYGGIVVGPEAMHAYAAQGKRTAGVQQAVKAVGQQVQQTQNVQAAVEVLEGRMQAAERVGQNINASLTLINDNVRAINPLDESSLKSNVQKISADIAALKARMG